MQIDLTTNFPRSSKTKRTPEKSDNNNSSISDDDQQPKRQCTTRSTVQNCYICKNTCEIDSMIQCKTCNKTMHYICLGMTVQFYEFFIIQKKNPWKCKLCNMKNIDETKHRTTLALQKIEHIQSKFSKVEDELDQQKELLNVHNQQIMAISETVARTLETNELRLNNLESNDEKFLIEICYIQGQATLNELVVTGIPIMELENLPKIMVNIGEKLSINLKYTDILKTYRMRNNTPRSSTQKFQSIYYKFTNQLVRNNVHDRYIEMVKSKQFINLVSIGFNQEGRVYINPKIPKCLSEIYKKAVEHKRNGIIQAVNPKISCISINIDDTWTKVQTMKQLEAIVNHR